MSERGSAIPSLARAAVGALLVVIGGIGLPAASVVVHQLPSVTPSQQAGMDTLMRLAPFILGCGVAHVIAGIGRMLGQAWGRPVAAAVSVAAAGAALAGIAVVADNVSFFVDSTSPSALASATAAVGVLSVIGLAYVVAAIAVVATRMSTGSAVVSPGWWAGADDRSIAGPA